MSREPDMIDKLGELLGRTFNVLLAKTQKTYEAKKPAIEKAITRAHKKLDKLSSS